MQKQKENILTITNNEGKLLAIARKDEKTKKTLLYALTEMNIDEIDELLTTITKQ